MPWNRAAVAAGSLWTLSSVLFFSTFIFPQGDLKSVAVPLAAGMVAACSLCFAGSATGSRSLGYAALGAHITVPLAWVSWMATTTGSIVSLSDWVAFAFYAFLGTAAAQVGLYLDSAASAPESTHGSARPLTAYDSGAFRSLTAKDSGGFGMLTASDSGSFRL
jgi:hypothetical protein